MSLSKPSLEQLLESLHAGEPEPAEELNFERSLTDNALRTLAPVQAPSDLSLRIRLALSHERVRAERRFTGRIAHQAQLFVENYIRPFGIQMGAVTVAIVATVAGIAMLGAVAPQQAVSANEEPLAGFSAPRYLYSSSADQTVGSVNDAPLIVKAMVDSSGRIYDYRILSGSLDDSASAALRQRMLTSVFRPARVFDQPVRGSVVLTFADVIVRA